MRASLSARILVLFVLAMFLQQPGLALPPGFDQAVQNYRAGKYSQSLSQLQTINHSYRADPLVHYYMALCYHCLNQLASAQVEYQWVMGHTADPVIRRNAEAGLQVVSRYQSHRTYAGHGGVAPSRASSSGRPKVLDFYADWCGPCKRLAPVLEEVQSQFAGRVDFQKIDIDDPSNDSLKQRYGVSAVPTLVFLDGRGGQVDKIVGGPGRSQLVQSVQQLLGN